jgi:YidC/Oxa1 family membrane protein insertase
LAEYHNPQQEGGGGGGDRRMLLIFAVTFAVIIIAQLFLAKNRPSPPQPKPAPAEATQSTSPAPESGAAAQPAAKAPGQSKASVANPSVVQKSASAEVETVVENSLYRIVFTNHGAQVKSWVLKKYKDEDGHPLDLVNKDAVKYGLPLSLWTYDENLRNQINSALYVATPTGDLTAPATLTYEYAEGDLSVRKTFQFGDSYVIGIETDVRQNGKRVQAYPAWPAGFGDQNTGPLYASARIDYLAGGKAERLQAKKVSNSNTLRGPFYWAGPLDQFFAAIFLPDNPDTAAMVSFREAITVPKEPKRPDPNNVNR